MEQAYYTDSSFYEQVSARLADSLLNGNPPWQKEWLPRAHNVPLNPVTGRRDPYVSKLMMMTQPYDDSRWMTYNEASSAGFQVRSGEHGTPILRWAWSEMVPKIDPATGEPELDRFGGPVKVVQQLEKPKAFIVRVFNAEQMDGAPPQEMRVLLWNPHERAEEILQGSGVPIKHDQNDRSFYARIYDEIHLPPKDRFPDDNAYYATALYELCHATSHASRLNRDLKTRTGQKDQNREDLVAEIASMMLCDEIGIAPVQNRNMALYHSWAQTLKNDPQEILRVCAHAERAVRHILTLERQRHPERNYGLETTRNILQSASPDLAVEQYLACRKTLDEARDNRDNVHVIPWNGQELFARKGSEILYSVPTTTPAPGDEFTIQSRVTAYDANGMEYDVKLQESLRQLENGGREPIAPVQPTDVYPTGRGQSLPLDWTGNFAVHGCVETGGTTRPANANEEIQFHAVFAVREDGTEVLMREFSRMDDAEAFADLFDESYKRQTGQTLPKARNQAEVQAYINVPFSDRQEARARGAMWDGNGKSWYIPVGMDAEKIPSKWPVHDPAITRAELEAKQAERAAKPARIYINVPREEKDQAKLLGARWDRTAVSWYVPDGVNPDPLTAKWPVHEPERQPAATQPAVQGLTTGDKVYLMVPYKEKDEAKQLGARFDRENKQWYAGAGENLEKFTRWLPENQVSVTPDLSPRDEFARVLESFGATIDGEHPIADGKPHRIATDGDKGTEKSGFYVLHMDGHPAGYVMNNRTQEATTWSAKGYRLDAAERVALQEKAAQTIAEWKSDMKATHNKTATRLKKELKALPPLESSTPYHDNKGIAVHPGVHVAEGSLCIPGQNIDGDVRTVQYIQEDGTKRFAKNSEHVGCFHVVGGMDELKKAPAIIISEGYATAASITESLGQPVVAAFNAGNLLSVAKELHNAMPDKPIIIAGDDDRGLEAKNKANVGKEKALEAAEAVQGLAVFPVFAEEERKAENTHLTDFNDLASKSKLGRNAVKSQIEAALEKAREQHASQEQAQEKTRSSQEFERV